MFHDGRSGSTVVGDLLNQQVEIFWDSEIFMPNRLNPLPPSVSHFLMRHPDRLIQARRMRTNKPFYGFEIKFAQLQRINYPFLNFIQSLQKLGFHHYLLLKRKNGLRRIVSDAVGRSKQVHSYHIDSSEKARLVRVKLDPDNISLGRKSQPLIQHLVDYERQFKLAELYLKDQKVLNLTYEDDINRDPQLAYEKICFFLGLDPKEVEIHFNKTNPFSLAEILINYDEVSRELSGTEYEWMLQDEEF